MRYGFTAGVLLAGCSGPSDSGDPVRETRTDTIDRARETGPLLADARQAREQQIARPSASRV
jgi:hypothetical protein